MVDLVDCFFNYKVSGSIDDPITFLNIICRTQTPPHCKRKIMAMIGKDHPKYYRINHSCDFVKNKHNHINSIENFWNQEKRVLRKYNGIPKSNFYLFIKECEFRFN